MSRMETPPPDLFRQQARQQYHQGSHTLERLRVSPPWTWWLVGLVVAALLTALVLAVVGTVEINTRAVAVLRPGNGVRSLTAQIPGSVRSVQARSGQLVRAGEVVLTLDAPDLQGRLLQSQRELDLLTSHYQKASRQQQMLHDKQVASVDVRLQRMHDQIASQRVSLAAYEKKWKTLASLADSGVVSKMSVIEAREAHAQAARQLASAQQALQQIHQELAVLASRRNAELWQQKQALKAAQSRHEALQLSVEQAVIRAPQTGTLEALVVNPGDVVTPGMVLGKLIPTGTPMRVVSFLAEKDRAFVKVGDTVRLELGQLPYGEYGTLGAKVVRISDSLATPYEVVEALGEYGNPGIPTYRVELEITDAEAAHAAGIRLRSGMRMQARFTLRRQRPITILLEPLRRWFR